MHRFIRVTMFLVLSLVLTCTSVMALEETGQGGPSADPAGDFEQLDTDQSGDLDQFEYEMEGLREENFEELDRDRSGYITEEEWSNRQRSSEPSEVDEARGLEVGTQGEGYGPPGGLDFDELDQDRSGSVTYDEYVRSRPEADEETLMEDFDSLDQDRSSDLSEEELEEGMTREQSLEEPENLSLSEYEDREIMNQEFEALDVDKDGAITWDEFNQNYPDQSLERLQRDFETMDIDASGDIDTEEWSGAYGE